MVRGIEGRPLFRDDEDYQAWVDRLAAVAETCRLTILAWACLPNHAHCLLRTGPVPLATAMRRLLTGYAGAFNRRHKRVGHLFQNRYKSILVEEEPYHLELVRYLHLNPVRAGIVKNQAALDRYRWSSHSALLGRVTRPWQAVGEVLGKFGQRPREARRRPVAQARAVLSYLSTQHLGVTQMAVAHFLGVTPAAVHLGVGRGPWILAARGLRAEELLPPSGRGLK